MMVNHRKTERTKKSEGKKEGTKKARGEGRTEETYDVAVTARSAVFLSNGHGKGTHCVTVLIVGMPKVQTRQQLRL